MISNILATDMKKHFDLLPEFKARFFDSDDKMKYFDEPLKICFFPIILMNFNFFLFIIFFLKINLKKQNTVQNE